MKSRRTKIRKVFRCCTGLVLVIIALTQVAQAQPTVTVEAQILNNYQSVIFTFIQNDLPSMEGCHYNLFTSDNRERLLTIPGRGLISIATFYKALPAVQIIAGPLPHVSTTLGTKHRVHAKSVKVYFRTLLSCPLATNGFGRIFSLTFKTFRDGTLKSVKELRNSMKYHMQYYQP